MGEMTTAERDAAGIEAEALALIEELSYVPPLEIARGLIEKPADLDTHHAALLAEAIRRMVAARATPPVARPLAAPPKGPKPPTIKSKPVKAEPERLI